MPGGTPLNIVERQQENFVGGKRDGISQEGRHFIRGEYVGVVYDYPFSHASARYIRG